MELSTGLISIGLLAVALVAAALWPENIDDMGEDLCAGCGLPKPATVERWYAAYERRVEQRGQGPAPLPDIPDIGQCPYCEADKDLALQRREGRP